jgi:quinol monooxygenase YgiN
MTNISPEEEIYTLINVFTVDPEKQQQLADTLIETTESLLKSLPGFISASIHKSLDGTKVVNYSYAQQKNKKAFEQLISDPQVRARMGLAVQLGRPDGHFYTVKGTITGSNPSENVDIGADEEPYTLINVFTVAPEKQQQLVETLIETTEGWVKPHPGFLAATIHKSLDETRVANYAQWRNKEAFDRSMSDPQVRARMSLAVHLGEPDGHFYTIERTIRGSVSL